MANVTRYEIVEANPNTGKVHPLHVKWADSRKIAIDGVRCTAEGAKVKVVNGDMSEAEARAALAHVVAKVLTEAGLKVAANAAGIKDNDKYRFADLREALSIAKQEGVLKQPKPKAEAVTEPKPDTEVAQAAF